MLQKIMTVLSEIFLENNTSSKNEQELFSPQNLTEHYQGEVPDMAMDGVFVATHYCDLESKIESYKYHSDRHHSTLFVDLLSKLMDEYQEISTENIVLVGVPMHWSRYGLRGFNHIDRLVKELANKKGLTVMYPLKANISRRQSQLSKTKRKKNREHAYVLKNTGELPRSIILIDDVISTGSTANACAKILKNAGVANVYGVFLASNQ